MIVSKGITLPYVNNILIFFLFDMVSGNAHSR